MATANASVKIEFSSTLTLSEVELNALSALVGYGDDAFIKVFYEKLGAAYMRDHEAGLRSAFKAIRIEVLPALAQINQIRRDLHTAIASRISAAKQEGGA
jgi:hypothetical protein